MPPSGEFGQLLISVELPGAVKCAWGPTGEWIAAAWSLVPGTDIDGGLVVVDARTGRERFRRADGRTTARAVAASPDGMTLAWSYFGGSAPNPFSGMHRLVDARSGIDMWTATPGGFSQTFSPDGSRVLLDRSFSGRGMHNAVTGELLWIGDRGARVFSPDGTLVLVVRVTESAVDAELVDATTGRVGTRLAVASLILGLAFDPSGARMRGFSLWPPVIQSFAVSDGHLETTIPLSIPDGHEFDPGTRRFALSRDHRLVALADPTWFAVFDLKTGAARFTPHLTLGTPARMEFSPGNAYVAVLSHVVTILDAGFGIVVFQQSIPGADGVFFSPAGDAFAVTGSRGSTPNTREVKIFGTGEAAGLAQSRRRFDGPVTSVAVQNAPAARAFAMSAGREPRLTVFNAATGALLRERSIPGVTTALVLSPKNDYVAVAGSDGTLRVYDLDGVVLWRAKHRGPVNDVAVGGRTGLVVTGAGTGDRHVRRFRRDLDPGEDPATHRPQWERQQTSAVGHIAISDDEQFLAIGCADRSTRLLAAATGEPLKTFTHDGQVRQLAFARTTPVLASANQDGSVLVIDVAAAKVLYDVGHPTSVTGVALNGGGTLLATATGEPDKTVRIFMLSPDRATLLRALAEPTAINAVAFSPTSRRLAIAPDAPVVSVIDPVSGTGVHRFPDTHAQAIAYSPDGTLLIVASHNTAAVFAMA